MSYSFPILEFESVWAQKTKVKTNQLFQNIQPSAEWHIFSPETFTTVMINFLKG